MKQWKAYPGADIDCDHNLFVLETELKLKTIKKIKIKLKLN